MLFLSNLSLSSPPSTSIHPPPPSPSPWTSNLSCPTQPSVNAQRRRSTLSPNPPPSTTRLPSRKTTPRDSISGPFTVLLALGPIPSKRERGLPFLSLPSSSKSSYLESSCLPERQGRVEIGRRHFVFGPIPPPHRPLLGIWGGNPWRFNGRRLDPFPYLSKDVNPNGTVEFMRRSGGVINSHHNLRTNGKGG